MFESLEKFISDMHSEGFKADIVVKDQGQDGYQASMIDPEENINQIYLDREGENYLTTGGHDTIFEALKELDRMCSVGEE